MLHQLPRMKGEHGPVCTTVITSTLSLYFVSIVEIKNSLFLKTHWSDTEGKWNS